MAGVDRNQTTSSRGLMISSSRTRTRGGTWARAKVNPRKNFHAAFTRGAVRMDTVLTNQTRLAIPDFQANQEQDARHG
jgi:hypothetical protein